jgi:NTE family protein
MFASKAIRTKPISEGLTAKHPQLKHRPASVSISPIVVNAETEPDSKWDRIEGIPPFGAVASSYSSIGIERYNEETIALLKENVKSWADEIKTERCKGKVASTEYGSCGDIQFYVVETKFDALKDDAERMYFKRLPTSFKLAPEQVDKLRDVAHWLLVQSEEFQRLLGDLR